MRTLLWCDMGFKDGFCYANPDEIAAYFGSPQGLHCLIMYFHMGFPTRKG